VKEDGFGNIDPAYNGRDDGVFLGKNKEKRDVKRVSFIDTLSLDLGNDLNRQALVLTSPSLKVDIEIDLRWKA